MRYVLEKEKKIMRHVFRIFFSLSLSLSSVSVLSRLVRSCVAQERFSKYAFFIFFFGIALVIALKEEGEDEEEEEKKNI